MEKNRFVLVSTFCGAVRLWFGLAAIAEADILQAATKGTDRLSRQNGRWVLEACVA
jgi:hypothetical protein